MDSELNRLLRRQEGVCTRAQALAVGLGRHALGHRVGRGSWSRILPSVYLTHGGAPSRRQRMRAALLYAGDGAAITSATACQLYGLGRTDDSSTVQIVVPRHRQPASHAFVKIRRSVRPIHGRLVDGFSVVPIERAVIDACRSLIQLDDVRALVAESVQRRRTDVVALTRELDAGERWNSRLARLALDEVSEGARSAAEAWALRLVNSSSLPRPEWNVELYANGRWLARPDAYWANAATVLEVDSYAWHLAPADLERTQRRHVRMTAAGLRVVHVSPNRIRDDPAEVVRQLADTIALGRPAEARIVVMPCRQ